MKILSAFLMATLALHCAVLRQARALILSLPPNLAQDVLSETVPTAIAPFELDTSDYALEWASAPIEGLGIRLAPGSLQWVRVMDVLSLPRARILVTAKNADSGRVTNAGFNQALDPLLRAEIPVALISGEQNPIDIVLVRGGKAVAGRVVLRFKPRLILSPVRVLTDPSCSRFGITATGSAQSKAAHGWAYIGCRVAEVENTEHRTSSLETYIFWDNVGQTIGIGGVQTPASSASVWPLRLRAQPGEATLTSLSGDEMKLRYFTPEVWHRASLGVGIGPYTDHFEGFGGDDISTVAPVATLYGSYFITEAMRVVAFGATTIDPHLSTDLGLYLNSEYLRIMDRRLVANLMLGAHVIGFKTQGRYYMSPGLPQGAEVSYLDAFKKGYNFTTGGFLYPEINGKSYYNIWFRYGSAKLFGEFNYISWSEMVNDQRAAARSAGISIGFPIAKFF